MAYSKITALCNVLLTEKNTLSNRPDKHYALSGTFFLMGKVAALCTQNKMLRSFGPSPLVNVLKQRSISVPHAQVAVVLRVSGSYAGAN